MVAAAKRLGVNKNTLLAYEHGVTLPDLTFLALFALEFKTELPVLLALRLKADGNARVRDAAAGIAGINPKILSAPAGHVAWALRIGLLSDIIEVTERVESKWRGKRFTPAQKARFVSSVYNFLHNRGEVDREALWHHVNLLRPEAGAR